VGTPKGEGLVKYVGKILNKDGDWIGVELDNPEGLNDGTVDEVRYFESKAKHGVFLRPEKVTRVGAQPPSLSKKPSVTPKKEDIQKKGSIDDVICATCNKSIAGTFTRIRNKAFHKQCFVCIGCRKQLLSQYQLDRTSRPFCNECFNFICGGCSAVIEGKFVRCKDQKFHTNCFKCSEPSCDAPILDSTFVVREEKPFCNKCADAEYTCGECKRVITREEKFIVRQHKIIHSSCFKCECGKQLNTKSFFERSGKPVCDECA